MATVAMSHLASARPSSLSNCTFSRSLKLAEPCYLSLKPARHFSKLSSSSSHKATTVLVCSSLTELSLGTETKRDVSVKAAADSAAPTEADATAAAAEGETSAEDAEKLAKLQIKLELERKMERKKIARRKRLLQKRRLRKKGSWPPSKMDKLAKV